MYAIVDIETTGSHAHNNGITEIAVVLHNGKEIEGRYETLINPGYQIPRFVASLTGISNEMVSTAPRFEEVALDIHRLLENRIFVAHNVNFDHSFLKYHFRQAGIEWNTKKLCTLRLSRKAFPGLVKYGLGHLCREMNIGIRNRHRAGGDADATAILFDKILEKGGEKLIKDFMRKEGREQILPPNLPEEKVTSLPYQPGVYYFHDAKGKVIYVGKAKCLKHRVVSHFTGSDTSKKRQDFLRMIHNITHTVCSNEFTASILESVEIKRLWPAYNYSQKRFEQLYGFYVFEDGRGYLRVVIDKKKKHYEPLASFGMYVDAHNALWKLVKDHDLHPVLCFLEKQTEENAPAEDVQRYNKKVKRAIQSIVDEQESFAIIEKAHDHHSCVLVEKGKFYGMGQLSTDHNVSDVESIRNNITQYPENLMIRSMVWQYAERNPTAVIRF